MPFVMLVTGTSSSGMPDQTSFQSSRLTAPCSALTPFECRLVRSARIVMVNVSGGFTLGLAEPEKFIEGDADAVAG